MHKPTDDESATMQANARRAARTPPRQHARKLSATPVLEEYRKGVWRAPQSRSVSTCACMWIKHTSARAGARQRARAGGVSPRAGPTCRRRVWRSWVPGGLSTPGNRGAATEREEEGALWWLARESKRARRLRLRPATRTWEGTILSSIAVQP